MFSIPCRLLQPSLHKVAAAEFCDILFFSASEVILGTTWTSKSPAGRQARAGYRRPRSGWGI